MSRETWTDAQKIAWDYIKSAYDEGLNQTESLREFREGGGHIRTADWGELWGLYDKGISEWETFRYYRETDTLPESIFTPTDINYTHTYNVFYRATVRDMEGNVVSDVRRLVGSDRRLTVGEWQQAIKESLQTDPSVMVEEVEEVADLEFYTR